MRRMHLILNFLVAALMFAACGNEAEDTPQTGGNITLSVEVLAVSYEKQTASVTVEADNEWGVYPKADWIKAQPSGGVAGTTTVKLAVEENKTGDVRESVVEFRSKGKSYNLTVKQNYDIEAVAIADANFLAALVEKHDTDGDGILSTKEAAEVRRIECAGKGIKSMTELATYFTEVTYLDCSDNELTELDVTALTKLEYLDCSGNNLSELDIQRQQKLTTLDCTDNANLTKIYVWFNFTAPEGFSKPAGAEYVEPGIAAPEGYELVWHDEFDTAGVSSPSPENWWYETGDGGWGNNELQDYVSGGKYNGTRIAEVSDGTLKITAQKIDGKVRSVRMNTVQSWTYGYFEGRLKLCRGKGTWPAFWMMPKNFRAWPDDGEIDIMEHVGYHENYVSSSIHCKAYYHSIGTQKTNEIHIPTATSEFHTYAVEWTPDYLKFYFDGVLHFTFKNDGKGDYNTWPFYNPFYLKLNLAWGGNWGGAMGVEESCLPTTYEIDYVRVFQKIE
uniref:family 16 glycosylhydrolase n=1 Tax=Alistipes sp. TaxID=1872444 RepID=UPI004055F023